MLTKAIRPTVTVALTALLIVMGIRADEESSPLLLSLGEDNFRACGLDKLTPDETDRLFTLVRPSTGRSHLNQSALRYLESTGWRQIEVLGIRQLDRVGIAEPYLVIADGYSILCLDPFGSNKLEDMPTPGIYWGKNSMSSWEIITDEGETRDFSAVDLR